MKELSVFIDESGDFGPYDPHSPWYIITMVFHDQSQSITDDIAHLDEQLAWIDADGVPIHAGPIIRREESYELLDVAQRRRILGRMVAFTRRLPITYRCFHIDKQQTADVVHATGMLSRLIALFIRDHYSEFLSFDQVKIYYDNGQIEVSRLLASVLNALLPTPVFRKVKPSEYRLFQVADLLCTMELIRLKLDEGNGLSRSEQMFFGNTRDLRKNYLKPLARKEWE